MFAKDALNQLIEGNKRFSEGQSTHPNRCDETKKNLVKGQKPFAVVLSCSDSRVPVEIIFDVGLGDIFVIRTAGHVLSNEVLGSIEYAVQHLGVNLIMILGHENCGAIKSAIKTYKENSFEKLSPYMQSIMKHIYPAIENVVCPCCEVVFEDLSVNANIMYQVEDLLKKDNFIFKEINEGNIIVAGAKYELQTGKIKIITKKSKADVALSIPNNV